MFHDCEFECIFQSLTQGEKERERENNFREIVVISSCQ